MIARGFFIYVRNQVNNVDDDGFYELAVEGEMVNIDVQQRTISCNNQMFPFALDPIEEGWRGTSQSVRTVWHGPLPTTPELE